jgi:hypothetical protein
MEAKMKLKTTAIHRKNGLFAQAGHRADAAAQRVTLALMLVTDTVNQSVSVL